MANQLDDDLQVYGAITCQTLNIPPGTVVDVDVAPLADIDPTKLRHQYLSHYAQVSSANAAVERKVIHVAQGAGTLVRADIGAVTAAIGAATATIDLLKNGTSILTTPLSLTSSTAAFVLASMSLAVSPTPLSIGDVLEINVTAATAGGGTLAKGLFGRVVTHEDYQ